MDRVLLVCEVFIGLFGVFSVVIADTVHERLHGLFVVGLALEGFLSYALSSEHPITIALVIVLTVIAILMIILSFHSLIEHVKKYIHYTKNPEVVPKSPSLEMADADNVDVKEICATIDARFDAFERRLNEREKQLDERERLLCEREAALLKKQHEN